MLKEELIEKCKAIAEPISNPDRLNNAINKLLASNCINLDNADERVLPGAVMAALFEDMSQCCLNGAFSCNIKKQVKKEYRNIKHFVPASW